jgi:alanyl-tRNA synthetase
MTHQELRTAFFKFYADRGHVQIPAAPLVPERDTSVLFTTAGMHPLIPYLTGDTHPDGTRLMNIQRSLRTTDVDEVGDATHLTVFEMLGHWSLGDYWKQEAIQWSYEFVTQVLGFSNDQLAVTIFQGDSDRRIGRDTEAEQIWRTLGVTRIAALGDDNFWGPVHSTGPCGPTTEIFVPASPVATQGQAPCSPDCLPGHPDHDNHWVEIWNNVFMGFNRTEAGTYEPLTQRNIDTGVGLERVLMTVNRLSSVYETDLYQPIVAAVSPTSDHANSGVRLVADHVKAAVFMIADGVVPTNKDRGYVLRRLIRRAVRSARAIKFTDWSLAVEAVVGVFADVYPFLLEQQDSILDTIVAEQTKFDTQLTRGEAFLCHALTKHPNQDLVELAFLAYQSHALPAEISLEILRDAGAKIDTAEFRAAFDERMAKHQQVSRAGSERKFGGHGLLLDTGELKAIDEVELKKVTRLHTATHLLQAALRAVLGNHVHQKGSDITAERLRFDFTQPDKLTPEQKIAVEQWVNDAVKKDVPVHMELMPLEAAKATGALHFIHIKYPPKVKVYYMGQSLNQSISTEFCGGPHVEHTGLVGQFKLLKEESVSAGTRRIKADVEY